MQRRKLLATTGSVIAIGIAGCSELTGETNPDAEELVNHYSEGYQTYQAAEETGSSATEYGEERKRQMRQRAKDLMEEAKTSFDEAAKLAIQEQTRSYCTEARTKARLKQSVFSHLAAGERSQALSSTREAVEYDVVTVSRVREVATQTF